MKTTQIIAAAALTLLAAVGAHAETYDGVQQVVSVKSRAAVDAEAVAAAHAPDQNINRSSKVAPALPSPTSRAAVAAEAVAAANAANQNLDRKSFVNSTVPAEYTNGSLATRRAGL
jgi:hypothetical protein